MPRRGGTGLTGVGFFGLAVRSTGKNRRYVMTPCPDPIAGTLAGKKGYATPSRKTTPVGGTGGGPMARQHGTRQPAPGHRDGTNPIPCLVPHTGDRVSVVKGLVSTRRGSEELGMMR